MIIETSDNRFYRVVETNQTDLAHVWYGFEVKKVGSLFVQTAKAARSSRAELVRKAATRIVEA
jgi:hypothetical protein